VVKGIILLGNMEFEVNMGRVALLSTLSALLSLAVFFVWFPFNIVIFGVYSGITFGAVLIALAFYVLTGFARIDQHQALMTYEIAKEQTLYEEVKQLAAKLAELSLTDSAKQADRLMGMLEDYRRVIEQKLGSTSITMSSYSSETGRVFNLAINNLKDMLAAAQSVHTIKADAGSEADTQSEALHRRQALLTQQEARISVLVEQNRELLTALNETTVQVANIKDINTFELQESLNRLRDLGKRAQSFSKD